ncbi:MAG: RsmB/NOP family class I SAM-dependent RNA methyltransferase [Candidatus Methanofastidiosia archaeon]|jgi:NOL1/NOP2/sun family putative RNA methylase
MREEFVERLKALGIDTTLYDTYPRKSVYISDKEKEIVKKFGLEPVLWADHCYWVDDCKEVQEGYYGAVFVQDAGSVVPVLALDIGKEDTVLDMCAAPGSKTLHIARRADTVVAVDNHRKRIQRLTHNLTRFNIKNCTVIRADGRKLYLDHKVDKVLVDAPCSGVGMVGKIHKAMKLWSVNRINRLSKIQKRLIKRGISLLKEGGVLVYSTCTFAPEENEAVVDYIVQKRDVTLEQIIVPHLVCTPGITHWKETEYNPQTTKTIRIYPFHNGTNGFFVAKFRK